MKNQIKLDGYESFFNTLWYWVSYFLFRIFLKPEQIKAKIINKISLRADESVIFKKILFGAGNTFQVTGPGLYCWAPWLAHTLEINLFGGRFKTQRYNIRRELNCGQIVSNAKNGYATTAKVTAVLKFKPLKLIDFEKLFGSKENNSEMLKNLINGIAATVIKPQWNSLDHRPRIPSSTNVNTTLDTMISDIFRAVSKYDNDSIQDFINKFIACVDIWISLGPLNWTEESRAKLATFDKGDSAIELNEELQESIKDPKNRAKILRDYVIEGATVVRGLSKEE